MKLRFYSFVKRKKSTMRPDDLQYVEMEVVIKEKTTFNNPVFVVDMGPANRPTANYCYLVEADTYYWIDDISPRTNNVWEIICHVDPYATAKDYIMQTDAYVIYSSSEYDRWINDERVPIVIKGSEYIFSQSAVMYNNLNLFEASSNETILITVVNAFDGIVTYVTDEAGLQALTSALTFSTGIWEDLQKQFGDAMGSIIQVMRLPINKNALDTGNYEQVWLGNSAIEDEEGNPIDMLKLTNTWIHSEGSVGMPATYTDFRFTEPYSKAKMSLPFVGVFDISLATLAPAGGINWRLDLDLRTGLCTWLLYSNSTSKQLASYQGQCGALVPIASIQIANSAAIVSGGVAGASATIGLAATGHEVTAALSGIGTVAKFFYSQQQMDTSVIGSFSGGRSEGANRMVRLCVEKFKTAIEPSNLTAIEGRPCAKVVNLANLTGYCRTQGFQLAAPLDSGIIDMVNAGMDSGIYLE